jgi:hypothetical protein
LTLILNYLYTVSPTLEDEAKIRRAIVMGEKKLEAGIVPEKFNNMRVESWFMKKRDLLMGQKFLLGNSLSGRRTAANLWGST